MHSNGPTSPHRLSRMQRRLLRHHLPIGLVSALCVTALYYSRGRGDVISWLSFSTAYPALVLIAITLLLGPWNLLRRKANPVSTDLRRDFGIWAGILSLVHAGIGQCVHLRGRPWLYYVYGPTEHHHGLRHDLFGFSNYTGAASVLLIALLFATSNDLSLRSLGTVAWKKLQRWNYLGFGLACAHTIGYFAVEKQKLPYVTFAVVCMVITVMLQLWGYAIRRRKLATQAAAMAIPATPQR